jgi:putative cell wall-binding protein
MSVANAGVAVAVAVPAHATDADFGAIGWGNDHSGQVTFPAAAASGVTAIAAGGSHSLALKEDGSVIGWGNNTTGQITVPDAAASGVTAIAAGGSHSLALKQDGSVIGWGNNTTGQITVPDAAMSGVTAIAAGGMLSLALKQDGSVIGMGVYRGEIPDAAMSGVTAIAAGYAHSLALKQDGSVIGWGYNSDGQATVPDAAMSGVTAIAAGDQYSLALKQDGSVIGWGRNTTGQITVPDAAASGVTAIAAGGSHSLALKQDGSVIGWGNNTTGQITVPDAAASGVTAIAAGGSHSLALKTLVAPTLAGVPPVGAVGAGYEFAFVVTGVPAPTVSVSGGVLADGLSLTRSGALTGTPLKAGEFSFTVTATSAAGTVELPVAVEIAPLVDRVAGVDRFETAVKVAGDAFPDGAPVVFLASGASFPDALSAAPAAARLGGPVLLTSPDTLPDVVRTELDRLAPSKVVIVGGVNAVSAAVADEVTQSGVPMERIAGPDRFATSRAVADYAFSSGTERAFVATGLNFPDALSAGAAIGSTGPVLLINGNAATVDPETIAVLDAMNVQHTFIAGGPAVVSDGIQTALQRQGTTDRLAGPTRYETSQVINAGFFSTADRVLLATGANFPDALTGAAWAPVLGAPLYVIPAECVPQPVLNTLTRWTTSHITALGGLNALTPSITTLTPCAP